ncbi:MAG: hypothetical protein ABI547_00195 [Betaproteobacteria bacterium]
MSTHESRGSECALLRTEPENGADRQASNGYANRLTRADRAIIARYFDGRGSLASVTRPARPSKMRRRWMIGGRLPATLRTDALPRELASELSALDPAYERLLVSYDVLCIELANSRIVDVMHNAGALTTQNTAQLLVDGNMDHAAATERDRP